MLWCSSAYFGIFQESSSLFLYLFFSPGFLCISNLVINSMVVNGYHSFSGSLHGVGSHWSIIIKEVVGVAYPLLMSSKSFRVGGCCWQHPYCVCRVSSVKLQEVRLMTKVRDSTHVDPHPQVVPVWTARRNAWRNLHIDYVTSGQNIYWGSYWFSLVLGSLVSSKGRGTSEVFSTELTFIGLLSTVGSLIFLQLSIFIEDLPTHRAYMWFLSNVDPFVHMKPWTMSKGLPTLKTYMWLLSSVDFLMRTKARALMKGFATLMTFMSLLSCVSSLMLFQGGILIEDFPTQMTFEWFLSSVNHAVSPEASTSTKGFSTLMTFIGLLSCVSFLMCFQGESLIEDFPTQLTFEWFLSSVNHLMSAKARESIKNFPTQSTFTWLTSSVTVTLSIEEWPLTKWFSMLFADIMFPSEGNYCILKWRCRSNFFSQISTSSRILLWVRNLLWGRRYEAVTGLPMSR